MRYRDFGMLLGVCLLAGQAWGQEKVDKSAPTSHTEPSVEVRFADDSTVKMALQTISIEVTTRYGKLSVPVGEIRRIEFGLHIPEETTKRITAAVAQLGSAEFRQREAASNELLELRELAYPALQRAANSEIAEVARRAKAVIKTLGETVPSDKLHMAQTDTIVAADFTIVGKVDAEALKVRTPYFGETSLKLVDLRMVRMLTSGRESKLSVDAARHGGPQESWMDTGIDIRAGAALQMTASGTVDLHPAGEAGVSLSGPDGMSSRGARGGNGAFANAGGPGGGGRNAAGRGPGMGLGNAMSPGTLVGKIGEFGKVFVVGSRFESPATDDGKLYLRIVPFPSATESTGSYDVKVNTGR